MMDRRRFSLGSASLLGLALNRDAAQSPASQTTTDSMQLAFEYDPQPPFHAGSPESAPAEVTAHEEVMKNVRAASIQARKRWSA